MIIRLNKNLVLVSLILLFFFKESTVLSAEIDTTSYNNNLQIINDDDDQIITNFKVKIISSLSDKEKGLMFVEDLPRDHGLLFNFEKEVVVNMWMKDTLIALDMIFIDKDSKIVKIAHSTSPLSKKRISSKKKVKMVLEINGSLAKKLNINVGDRIQFFQ